MSGFEKVASLEKYLGIQLFNGRIKKANFAFPVDRARQKLSGWKIKSLSLAGCLTLSQSTLSTLLNFVSLYLKESVTRVTV